MPMIIFFPLAYYYPEQCAGIYIVEDLMQALADEGIGSCLSVPSPTRNVVADAKWNFIEIKRKGKIVIHRFKMYGERKNPFSRALRYFLCECVQMHRLLWGDYDLVFIDSTPPIQGLKLPIVRLFRRKPVVFNLHDLFPDSLYGSGLAKKGGILWKVGNLVMRITYRNVDKIITISEEIRQKLLLRGIPSDKIEVVYNWVDTEAVHPVEKEDNPLFEEFGIDRDIFTVVYAGNLGNAQNISIILDAASQLPNVQFAIFGTGGMEEKVRERIASESLINVHLNPLQPVERVSEVYSLGDACIVSCKAGFGGSAMPSKTWSIMACGRPVIASFDEGELKDIIEKNDCGVFSHAGDVEEFVDAIRRLASDPLLYSGMGANARRFVLDNLTKEVGTQKYIDVIKSFDKNNGPEA